MDDVNAKDVLFKGEPSRFTQEAIDLLLIHCSKLHASDITIQTDQPIIAEIHGRLLPITQRRLSNTEVSDLINMMYGPNGTTQLRSGRDIDTSYEVKPNRNERYRHRVNATACEVDAHEAIQITLRTIPSLPPLLETLNLPQVILDNIAPAEGVIYVTGATGSGKTTLLASVMRSLIEDKDANRKVLCYEAPIEFVYDGLETPSAVISQTEIPRHLPTFAAGVRNALRRKPHAILVGESRDAETIAATLEAALTGHPVYTTLHSNGVAETIRRLVNSFAQEERLGRTIDIIETCRLIIWQRLVPSTDGKRVPLREYLVFTEDLRDELLDSDPAHITDTTRKLLKKYGQTMQSDVEKKFKEGLIDQRTFNIMTARLKAD
jgi:defect in organelle trafficking protein DotB